MSNKELKSKRGITLIALVVTIVVLLILAGITINLVFADGGILQKAQDAADAQREAAEKDQQAINDLGAELNRILEENGGTSGGGESSGESGNGSGGSGSGGSTAIPEGLEVGSTVTYNPSGTYNWKAKYCSSSKTATTDDVPLSSATGESFNITSWNVLSIDEEAKTVQLVPSKPTTGTVYLEEAQGYNNAVKLLNEACSNLYGNSTKGIEARSINITDIEDYMTTTAVAEAHASPYKGQTKNVYTSYKNYPIIYAQEKLAFINETPNGDTGLDLSDQNSFIERTAGTSTTSNVGAITNATSIQPYQTFWTKDATYMANAFQDYTKRDTTTANYSDLIMPSGASTTYWVASRCVRASSVTCTFYVRSVDSGEVGASYMYTSAGGTDDSSRSLALFPVVTLSSNLIKGSGTTFSVKQ